MATPCGKRAAMVSSNQMSPSDADKFLKKLQNLAKQRSQKNGSSIEASLKEIAGELKQEELTYKAVRDRAALLTIQRTRHIKEFVKRFPTIGEGLLAYLEGGKGMRKGERLSVDYQAKALHQKYFGRLAAELEEAGLLQDFRRNEHEQAIFQEMWELSRPGGTPGASGNKAAVKIAQIVESITAEMVAQQNRAGAYIQRLPGWILRQSHDRGEIRAAGGPGRSAESKKASFDAWRAFVEPLLDHERTFRGVDPEEFLNNVHEGLYSGIHGPDGGEDQVVFPGITEGLHNKVSAERVLHFKDWKAAYDYNQRFGIRSFKDSVFSDVYFRTRNIALMEGLGPNPGVTWTSVIKQLGEEYRKGDDAAKQTDSLKSWKLKAAFETVSGNADIPANYGLTQWLNVVKAVTIMAKMGATVISALSDKVFINHEMAYLGMSNMQKLAANLHMFGKNSPEEKRFYRMAGVGMDGLIGSVISRYTAHTTVPGAFHKLQQGFFNLNFLGWWTDAHKQGFAKVLAADLGDHADMPFEKINPDMQRALQLYEIGPEEWELLRPLAWQPKGGFPTPGVKLLTADKIENIEWGILEAYTKSKKLEPTVGNVRRVRDELESKLRTFMADRADYAVPTPGAAEKKWLHFGTQDGTPLGSTLRLLTMFKSFPVTILTKIMARERHGRGAATMGQWMLNDHAGKFNLAMMIAMTSIAGYLSGAMRDALKGRTPKRLLDADGFHKDVLVDAMLRGGGLSIMGDFMFTEYDRQYRSAASTLAGPVLGQLDPIMSIKTRFQRGEFQEGLTEAGKFFQNNTPYINLFYIRPVLDYFIFWNLQEMLAPGSLEKMEKAVEGRNHQGYFFKPSDSVE
jgi:hypothetical protein